jgi:hypothetical protein
MEEGIETQELKEKLDEAHELAHGGGHGGGHGDPKNAWIVQLSLSTALLAVLAAIAALESGDHANESMVKKNESILNQTKASDQWAFYQAKGIKSAIYRSQSEVLGQSDKEAAKEPAKKLAEDGKREKEEQEGIKKAAEDFEKKAEESDKESERDLRVHHEYARAVTIFQVSIALAAIGALTKKRPMWLVSMGVGLLGVFFFVRGLGLL